MFSRDEIPRNSRLREPISVLVREVSRSRNDALEYEVTIADAQGNLVPLDIWATHEFTSSLEEGHRYELTGVRGKRWNSGGTTRYKLSSTADFAATDLGPPTSDATRFLVVGDTHVGYRHRPRSKKAPWARNVDARDVFRRILERAVKQDVDAVIHAGDLFDHVATGADRNFVAELLVSEFDEMPFYYVYGNHDVRASRLTLDKALANRSESRRLTHETTTIPPATALYGYDYLNTDFPGPSLVPADDSSTNVLVVHDTPYPVVDDANELIQAQDGADFRDALDQTSVSVDLVVCGHMHVGAQGTLANEDVPVIVTGPPERLSKATRENTPSIWLVTVDATGLRIERQPL